MDPLTKPTISGYPSAAHWPFRGTHHSWWRRRCCGQRGPGCRPARSRAGRRGRSGPRDSAGTRSAELSRPRPGRTWQTPPSSPAEKTNIQTLYQTSPSSPAEKTNIQALYQTSPSGPLRRQTYKHCIKHRLPVRWEDKHSHKQTLSNTAFQPAEKTNTTATNTIKHRLPVPLRIQTVSNIVIYSRWDKHKHRQTPRKSRWNKQKPTASVYASCWKYKHKHRQTP